MSLKELIITEKPSAAKKIAEALSESKIDYKKEGEVIYYIIKRANKEITIVPAVGHIFTVAEKVKSFKYPSFDLIWKPVYEENKNSNYVKKYADLIKEKAKNTDNFVIACDFDVEGELIGYNILRFICNKTEARRMKFSALTKPDLIDSYENILNSIVIGQAKAGEVRHFLDWLYGINLSRALTLAVRKNKVYTTMSSGRVQGPALKILYDREIEIKNFKPQKYWQLILEGKVKNGILKAIHEKDSFFNEDEVNSILKKIKGKNGFIKEIKKTESKQQSPNPFDLTTLQTESYSLFGFNPAKTLEYAQELYVKGYISYPRTSSQQLNEKIGFKKIITALTNNPNYAFAKSLLNKTLKPNNGKKTDPAHPAIYPTGIMPENLDKNLQKLYDLIVKRFFATFGESALRETQTIKIDIENEIFISKGTITKEKGWHIYYEPYVRLKEEELPQVELKEKVETKKIEKIEKETQGPKRYNEASLIKELESRNLGTKSTRAEIIETLYKRGYIQGKQIEVTQIGFKLIETLEKYSPDIIDENLTRKFELEMEEIRELKQNPENVLNEAKIELTKILEKFKKNEQKIGESLALAAKETEDKKNYIGKCPVCKNGNLKIIHIKKNNSKFIACDKYPECKTTFSIPQNKIIKSTNELCSFCGYPVIEIISTRSKQKFCLNLNCESKRQTNENNKNLEENKTKQDIINKNSKSKKTKIKNKETNKETKTDKNNIQEKCPKCNGSLVLRQSIYGQFYGCSNYPKCKFIKPINKENT
ncbi:MAG: DNA topoisomerase I [Candidatus Woesearchaeota archaeon]